MRLSQSHQLGYVLTALGFVGILFSLSGETSDYVDPLTFTIAAASIFVAVVGLALAFRVSDKNEDTNQQVKPQNQNTV